MAKFHYYANIMFEADDIADAFLKIGDHFTVLRKGEDSDLEMIGTMWIEPAKEKQDND